MNTLLTVLSNKFDSKRDPALMNKRLQTQQPIVTAMHGLLAQHPLPDDTTWTFRAFRSILHYLAGDVARLRPEPYHNTLLGFVVENVPTDIMLGRQFAQNLGLITTPRECLSDANHAVRNKLGVAKLYHKIVRNYFDRCYPGPGVDEREAVNRAVAIFSILQHLEYKQYSCDAATIVRLGIRSLSTFKVGVETESMLAVLLHILQEDPSELREHLAGLIQGLTAVYGMARNVADAARFKPSTDPFTGREYRSKATRVPNRDPIATRMYTLRFFQQLTESGYDAHLLLPHRRGLLRPLAAACGDSVREIRRTALKARQAWEGLE
jgi:DNA repair/transcription protein MET18/MMS19